MRLMFKANKVDEAAVKNFKEFDFSLNDNRLPLNSVNIGCGTANSIVDLKWREEIANEDTSKFRKRCKKMLIVLNEKRLEQMAVSLHFLRRKCVIPTNIWDKEKGRCTKQFQRLVHYLSGNSIITTAVSDKAYQE